MESHSSTEQICQNLIKDPDTGDPLTFMYYRGVSPFCPCNANEDSRWVVYDFKPYFYFQTEDTVKIECKVDSCKTE